MYSEKFITTRSILKNIEFFQNLLIENQNNCSPHLPIILGDTNTIMIYNNESLRLKYKRCLLCGKVLTFEKPFLEEEYANIEFYDATDYKKDIYKSNSDNDEKFKDLLDEYEILSKTISSKEELQSLFELYIKENSKIKKRTVNKTL